MLTMVNGCHVHDPSLLCEGFRRIQTGFQANVDASNICAMVERFIQLQAHPLFLILEVATQYDEEIPNEQGEITALHNDVYYLDGLTTVEALEILHTFSAHLIHDGMSIFGFGCHDGENEIMINKYNVAMIYTKNPERYTDLFASLGIPETPDLKTAWHYFTQENYGECDLIVDHGKTIYDVVECLKECGLYFAERRES